jgi:hypothetical protein
MRGSDIKLSFLIVCLERFRSKIGVFSTPGRLPDPFAATRGTRATTGPERTLGIAARLGRAALRLGHHRSYLRDAPAHRETASRAARRHTDFNRFLSDGRRLGRRNSRTASGAARERGPWRTQHRLTTFGHDASRLLRPSGRPWSPARGLSHPPHPAPSPCILPHSALLCIPWLQTAPTYTYIYITKIHYPHQLATGTVARTSCTATHNNTATPNTAGATSHKAQGPHDCMYTRSAQARRPAAGLCVRAGV